MVRARDELAALGVKASEVLGPLLRKSAGTVTVDGVKRSLVMAMPLLVSSTYDFVGRVTKRAYEEMRGEGGDPELVVGKGHEAPRFAHHSWRRLADTVAEEAFARGECSEQDINLHFGWQLKKYKKKMRLHYADRGARTARARLMEGM